MNKILKCILNDGNKSEVKTLIRGGNKISLFTAYPELKNKTLYAYFQKYKRLKNFTLETLIKLHAVDITELNGNDNTLLQAFIADNDINSVKMLLLNGGILRRRDEQLTKDKDLLAFLTYKPGSNESSLINFCAKHHQDRNYLDLLQALLLDYEDTTDESSSEAASISSDESLSESEQEALDAFRTKQLNRFNKNPETGEGLQLVAARGVHFCPRYFSRDLIKRVKENRHNKHPTFSQSTLFDAGYEADSEVSEKNKKIKKRHAHNLAFIETLKAKDDKKEITIGSSKAPVTRNKQEFESLYYRYMQVYINSYSRLFNDKTIKIDFGFDSTNNPEVSASWYFHKGAMYGSGQRFDWENKDIRRDPHYRRFTGKPKHPNMGYLDVYAFDVEYVREHGFDRQLMCADRCIRLSAMFRAEGEIIFHSMIPSRFHQGRHILSLPSFDGRYGNSDKVIYGLSRAKYNAFKNDMLSLPADKASDAYKKFITFVTQKAAMAQGNKIENTTHLRLFRNDNKVVVHDHGKKLAHTPFKL